LGRKGLPGGVPWSGAGSGRGPAAGWPRSLEVACRVLAVSEWGYQVWRSRPPSRRPVRHVLLTDLMIEIHTSSRGIPDQRVFVEGHLDAVNRDAILLSPEMLL
jgi:hypothetical protein